MKTTTLDYSTELNKEILFNRINNNQKETEIYKYSNTIVETINKYIKQKHLQDDLYQDCFMKILLKFDKYSGEGSFEGWIKRVVSNTCLDYLRWQSNQRITYLENEQLTSPSSLITPLHLLEAEDTNQLIQGLPKKSKEVLELYVYEGLNHKEISAQLGIKESSSRSQLVRARKSIKEKIEQQEIIFA